MHEYDSAYATPIWRLVGVLFLLVHTAMCIEDFITFVRLIKQAPANSLVLNNGWIFENYVKFVPEYAPEKLIDELGKDFQGCVLQIFS